jgi:hypothetical protein
VDFSGDAKRALALAADELAKLGYTGDKQQGDELVMSFKGKWLTTDPAKMKHKLTVKPDASQLSFAFSTGLIASHWSDSDKAWAQGRADEVVAAVVAQLS